MAYSSKTTRDHEVIRKWAEERGGNWEKVYDAGVTPLEDQREVDLSEIEIDLSSGR